MKLSRAVMNGPFLVMAFVLLAQAAALRVLSLPERPLPGPRLHDLPYEVGAWRVVEEQALDPTVNEYLKPDDYVIRDYQGQEGSSVNLFLAYFKSLQNAYGPHSPKVCLPGAGWLVRSSKIASIQVPGRVESIPVNEYVMERSGQRIAVIYWYQNNRSVWAEEFRAKLTMLPDLIKYRRSDVSLVRLIAPVRSDEGVDEMSRCAQFAKQVFPLLADRFESNL